MRAVADFFDPRSIVGVHGDVFDREDPMPFVFEVQSLAKGWRRGTE
jgi:hypothetical protein